MIPTPWRILIIATGAILAGLFLYHQGQSAGELAKTEEYLPQLAVLKTVIETADAQALANQKTYQENHHAIETENADLVNRVTGYYERMLRDPGTRDQIATITPAAGPEAVDDSAGEPAPAGHDPEFERACALDAVKVLGWQRWAVRNRIPVE